MSGTIKNLLDMILLYHRPTPGYEILPWAALRNWITVNRRDNLDNLSNAIELLRVAIEDLDDDGAQTHAKTVLSFDSTNELAREVLGELSDAASVPADSVYTYAPVKVEGISGQELVELERLRGRKDHMGLAAEELYAGERDLERGELGEARRRFLRALSMVESEGNSELLRIVKSRLSQLERWTEQERRNTDKNELSESSLGSPDANLRDYPSRVQSGLPTLGTDSPARRFLQRACGSCGKGLITRMKIAGYCTAESCELPICSDCHRQSEHARCSTHAVIQ